MAYGSISGTFKGLRALDGYDVMDQVLRSPKAHPQFVEQSAALTSETVLKLSGDRHSRRRVLESRLFRPESLRRYEAEILRPTIERAMATLQHDRDETGVVSVDLADFGRRLIMELTASIIGLDGVDGQTATSELFEMLVSFTDCIKIQFATEDAEQIIARAVAAKDEYWRQYVRPARDRRKEVVAENGVEALSDDLLSLIVSDASGTEEWTDDLTLRECILYLVATGATTITLISHVVAEMTTWLHTHPEDSERFDDDEFLSAFINESLRLHPPSPAAIRECPEGLHVRSADIAPGETVYMDLFNANKDETVFGADAREFKPERQLPKGVQGYGLSFGVGRHACIGRPLAIGGAASGTMGATLLMMRALIDAGVRVDPSRTPKLAASLEGRYDELYVILDKL